MNINTKRLTLRPWIEEDCNTLYNYAKDPRIGSMTGFLPHTSPSNSLEIIKTILSKPLSFAVTEINYPNHPIGSISLMNSSNSNISIQKNEFEIGYWIAVPFWGKGYIPEAVNKLLEYAFFNLNTDTVWCGYYDTNIQSKRVNEKCGFNYKYTINNSYIPILKEHKNRIVTSITKAQWEIIFNQNN